MAPTRGVRKQCRPGQIHRPRGTFTIIRYMKTASLKITP